jgi:2-keto-4-pentenoate hydratase/2-oxohepta-3-ene-1,7-dioic acid hydratase in catechol pathway
MKIAKYLHKDTQKFGAIDNNRVISLPALAKQLGEPLPLSIEEFIAQNATAKAEALIRKAKPSDLQAASTPLTEVKLLAPIAFPPKILCLGWNYIDHAAERKVELPQEPVVFMKPHTTIVATGDSIVKPQFVTQLDYEGELAVVMGKTAKNVSAAEALDYVFGYTILDDVSARDFQFKDKQWTRGKGFDTFAPTGPCIVTKDQLPDTGNLSVRTWVNGELRQDGNTRDMVFTVAQIIYHLSRVMTLEHCDVISTGTPSGVAMAMKEPKWLKHDDVVRIEIENIGILENKIVER